MQDDKDDGATWLVDQGYVDADKIAIHGYSGFAAIAAVVRANSPYQCAVAVQVLRPRQVANEWGDLSHSTHRAKVLRSTAWTHRPTTNKANIPDHVLYHGDYDSRADLP
jgi:dipeptidyl aminopeptidase/acylaminoacyl peptidase